jgi:hypothetical protein
MDETDKKIIELLQQDGRMEDMEIARKIGCVLNNVAYSKNCHNGSFEIMRCPSKKAPCGSMSCWFIYTPHHLYSILYIKVTIRGTLPKNWGIT